MTKIVNIADDIELALLYLSSLNAELSKELQEVIFGKLLELPGTPGGLSSLKSILTNAKSIQSTIIDLSGEPELTEDDYIFALYRKPLAGDSFEILLAVISSTNPLRKPVTMVTPTLIH